MAKDNKPSLLMLIGKAHKDKGKSMESEDSMDAESDDNRDLQLSAMKDLVAAIRANKVDEALDAYQDLCDLHQSSSGDESDDEEY